MRVTDLMVDDWVQWGESYSNMNGDYDVYWEDKQLSLNDFAIMMEEDWDDIIVGEFVSPIPLTAEILRKNGFEETPTSDLFIEKNLWDKYAIELFPSEGSWILRITDKTNKYIDGCNRINLYINYIHELQHAFKLCGIDKQIEL